MARRDVAAAAAKSWPDTNHQFVRFRDQDSRTRGPGGGRDAIGTTWIGSSAELTAERRSPQRIADEVLFAPRGRS
jgi:hypothetical protein